MVNIQRRTLLKTGAALTVAAPLAATSLAPAHAAGENLLLNPAFEEADPAVAGQAASWFTSTPQFVSRDATSGRDGTGALHIAAASGNGAPWANQIVEVAENMIFEFTVWVKRAITCSALIKFEYYNSTIEFTAATAIPGSDVGFTFSGSAGDWELLTAQVTTPIGTRALKLYLRAATPVDLWYDDASFVLVGTLPPAQLQMYTDHGVYYPDITTGHAILTVTPEDESFTGKQVRLTIADEAGTVAVTNTQAATPAMDFTFATSALALRTKYSVKAELVDSGGVVLSHLTQRIVRWERPLTLNIDEELIVDGKPFCPVSMYHVSTRQYHLMPEVGVNLVQLAANMDVAGFKASLDLAHSFGLKALVVLYRGNLVKENADWHRELIPAVKDHPAALAWALVDEPDATGKMAEIFDGYCLVRSLDDVHPVYLVSAYSNQYRNVEHCCDVLVTDPYPIGHHPISLVSEYVDLAVEVTPAKPTWNILQAFQIPGSSWTVLPTIDEVRNMAHQSINHGSTGLGYYSMADPGWELENSALWEGLVGFTEELSLLQDLAVSRTARLVSRVTTETWEFAVHQLGRNFYGSLLNLVNEEQTITATLPRQACGTTAQVLYGSSSTAPVQVGTRQTTWQATLPRHGAHMIRFSR